MSLTTGTLYIVATPIGNVLDMSERGKTILQGVDGIVAEDTRRAGKLLAMLNIKNRPPLMSFHTKSAAKKREALVKRILTGESLAYISDAGTPGISDPGTRLARAAWDAGLKVIPIPGPSAVVTAVSAAGLPSHRILFYGFIPNKKGRKSAFDEISQSPYTVVTYESRHRIFKTLEELDARIPDREICAAKELTKVHERFFFGTASTIVEKIQSEAGLENGEWVLIIPPGRTNR